MREYGKLYCGFWTSPDIRGLSDRAKMLAAYLLTSAHTTMLGCFRLPMAYLQEDLKWEPAAAGKAMDELITTGFVRVDEDSWIMVVNYLQWNAPENPNQGSAMVKVWQSMPDRLVLKAAVADKLQTMRFIKEGFRNGYETVDQPLPNKEKEQEKEQKQEKEDERYLALRAIYPKVNKDGSAVPKSDSQRKEHEAWRAAMKRCNISSETLAIAVGYYVSHCMATGQYLCSLQRACSKGTFEDFIEKACAFLATNTDNPLEVPF